MRHMLMFVGIFLAVILGPGLALAQTAEVVKQKSEAAYKEYIKAGSFLAAENRYKEAIESFRKAISVKPEGAEAYSLMGSALAMAGRDREAEEALRKAVSLQPNYAEGYNFLGHFLKSRGRNQEAEEAFRKAKQYQR
ncbi:MAG: tetratricopeptide repeat protein [Desulfobaccales bacterium]